MNLNEMMKTICDRLRIIRCVCLLPYRRFIMYPQKRTPSVVSFLFTDHAGDIRR